MKRFVVYSCTALLIVSGCGSTSATNTGTGTGIFPSPAITSAPTPAASLSTAAVPTPAITAAAPSPSPSASIAPAAVAKSYKMNKNYDIVPVEADGSTPKKVVLLTFDDGPKSKDTLVPLLDTLDKHKAKAIFFVNGYRVKQNPELLKLIHERGQIIGNHSWDHIDLKKENNAKIDQQVGDVQHIVKELVGEAPVFFRPPHGSGNDYLREKVKQEKMLYMTWSNGSLDWDLKTGDKHKEIIDNVMKQLHPGSNILMHELSWTAETLDDLLTQLEAKEYGFVNPLAISTE